MILSCSGETPTPNVNETERPAAADGVLFRSGDVVAYTLKNSSGAVIGRTHSTYLVNADHEAQVMTRCTLEMGVSTEVVSTLRSDLSPSSVKQLSSIGGRTELHFKDRSVLVVTDTGARELPYVRDESMLLPGNDLMMLALALKKMHPKPGTTIKLPVLSPTTFKSDEWSLNIYADAEGTTVVKLPQGKAVLDASGRIARLETDEGFSFLREDPPGAPPKVAMPAELPRYVRPPAADWTDREVSIDVEGGQLAGTLSEPKLRTGANRTAPGVIFLSGSGAQDRHGYTGPIDLGTWQILDHLAEEGFVVLRVDDRGAGTTTSKLPAEDVGLKVLLDDARAMLRYLRTQPSVDPEHIFVLGHSLGAITAIMAAGTEELAGVVLISAPFRSLPEIIVSQQHDLAGADRERAAKEMRSAIAALKGNETARSQVDPAKFRAYDAMRALLVESSALDMEKALANVEEDIAVFQGMKDFQVSWREDAKPLVEALNKHNKKRAKLYAYENVDHLMKAEPGESSLRRYADRNRRIEGRFLGDLVAWLRDHAARKS
jgi:dienelactone hydrolase